VEGTTQKIFYRASRRISVPTFKFVPAPLRVADAY